MESNGAIPAESQRKLAILIGIDRYQGDIPRLANAVHDIRTIANALRDLHGYQVRLIEDEQATLAALRALLIALPDELRESDRLVLYFAGHGVADSDDPRSAERGGHQGYLIPVDACRDRPDSFLPMAELQRAIERAPCKHLLLCLDCCFAGAFRWATMRDMRIKRKTLYRERVERYLREPVRQIIASAGADERALDVVAGRVFGARDNSRQNSPFAAALHASLRGEADLRIGGGQADGIVVASELHLYIEEALKRLEEQTGRPQQHPILWSLPGYDKGEFVFTIAGRNQELPSVMALSEKNNPYRGLSPFEESHGALFFGRNAVVKELAALVQTSALTVVVGMSGTGKTSLVRAGLLPQLRKTAGPAWRFLPVVRPEKRPLAALQSLVRALEMPAATSLAQALAGFFAQHAETHLVLVVDQLEELITMAPDAAEHAELLAQLAQAIERWPGQLHVVMTLRADFEPHFSAFLEARRAARFLIKPMNRDELREAIEMPASERVLYFEPPSLVDRIIDEVVEMPGGLPLLSFTLSEMYRAYLRSGREDRTLTAADYKALGEVGGALSQRADHIFEGLDLAHRRTLQRVMLRMVSVVAGEIARRRVTVSELKQPPENPEQARVQKVLDALLDARLIVAGKDAQGEAYFEPAHDKLVLGWKLLWDFIKQMQDVLPLMTRVGQAAADWQRAGRPDDALWDADPRLPQAVDRQKKQPEDYNWLEGEFIAVSERRRRRRRALGIGGVGLVLAMMSLLTVTAWRQKQQAEAQKQLAEQRLNDATEVTEALVYTVDRKLGPIAGVAPIRRELLDFSEKLLEKLLRNTQERPNTLRIREGRLIQEADLLFKRKDPGLLEGAQKLYQQALALAEQIGRLAPKNLTYRTDIADCHMNLSRVLRVSGQLQAARAEQDAATAIYKEVAAAEPRNLHWQLNLAVAQAEGCRVLFAGSGRTRGQDQCWAALTKLWEIEKKAPDDLEIQSQLLPLIASVCDMRASWDLMRDKECYEEALAIGERLLRAAPYRSDWRYEHSEVLLKLGWVLSKNRAFKEAGEHYDRALKMREQLSQLDPDSLQWQRGLALGYARRAGLADQMGRRAEALEWQSKGLAIFRKVAAADPRNSECQEELAQSAGQYGRLLEQAGKRDEALKLQEEALAILQRLLKLKPNNDDLMRLTIELAIRQSESWVSLEQLDKAAAHATLAVTLSARWAKANTLSIEAGLAEASAHEALSKVQAAQGQLLDALSSCGRARKIVDQWYNSVSNWLSASTIRERKPPAILEIHCLTLSLQLGDEARIQQHIERTEEALSNAERELPLDVTAPIRRRYTEIMTNWIRTRRQQQPAQPTRREDNFKK